MKRLIAIILLIMACSRTKDKEVFQQMVETHDLAIKIGKHVNENIIRIGKYAEKLENPLKTLLKDSLSVLIKDYTYWESTVVEVPGHNHKDIYYSGHDHSHEPVPNLTLEMMLEVQRDLRDRIVILNFRVQNLLNTLEKKEKNESVEEKEKASSYGT